MKRLHGWLHILDSSFWRGFLAATSLALAAFFLMNWEKYGPLIVGVALGVIFSFLVFISLFLHPGISDPFTVLLCEKLLLPNSQPRPNRIIFLRHGESLGNCDQSIYTKVADNQVPLSETGMIQAKEAGKRLFELLGDESIQFYVSPYLRCKQTLKEVLESANNNEYRIREDPRLREQDFGNFQDTAQMEVQRVDRDKFGSFYFRWQGGEAGSDVFDRASSFLETLHRDFRHGVYENMVIVSHGLTIRLILMRYFHYTVDEFQDFDNLRNCEMILLSKQEDGKFTLDTPLRRWR